MHLFTTVTCGMHDDSHATCLQPYNERLCENMRRELAEGCVGEEAAATYVCRAFLEHGWLYARYRCDEQWTPLAWACAMTLMVTFLFWLLPCWMRDNAERAAKLAQLNRVGVTERSDQLLLLFCEHVWPLPSTRDTAPIQIQRTRLLRRLCEPEGIHEAISFWNEASRKEDVERLFQYLTPEALAALTTREATREAAEYALEQIRARVFREQYMKPQ